MHCYTSGKATIEKKQKLQKISPISRIMKCLVGADNFSGKCRAQGSGQHTWRLLLLLRTKMRTARFPSACVWACLWDGGGFSQRINARWASPCPCKLIEASCLTAISAFGKVPSNSSSQTHCPESVLLSVYTN